MISKEILSRLAIHMAFRAWMTGKDINYVELNWIIGCFVNKNKTSMFGSIDDLIKTVNLDIVNFENYEDIIKNNYIPRRYYRWALNIIKNFATFNRKFMDCTGYVLNFKDIPKNKRYLVSSQNLIFYGEMNKEF